LAFTNFIYNVYIVEIFLSLLNKTLIILCNKDEYNNPGLLSNLINKYKVEGIVSPPTRINYYIKNENFRNSIISLSHICFGGEVIKIDFLKKISEYTNADLYCGYGTTEISISCVYKHINNIKKIINNNE